MGCLMFNVEIISRQVSISIERMAWCFAAPWRVGGSSILSRVTGAVMGLVNLQYQIFEFTYRERVGRSHRILFALDHHELRS